MCDVYLRFFVRTMYNDTQLHSVVKIMFKNKAILSKYSAV